MKTLNKKMCCNFFLEKIIFDGSTDVFLHIVPHLGQMSLLQNVSLPAVCFVAVLSVFSMCVNFVSFYLGVRC